MNIALWIAIGDAILGGIVTIVLVTIIKRRKITRNKLQFVYLVKKVYIENIIYVYLSYKFDIK